MRNELESITGSSGDRLGILGLLILGIIGMALVAAGAVTDPRQAAFSYLAAYALALSLALGALLFLMIQHTVGAPWSVVFSDPALAISGTLPLLGFLVVPVFLGWNQLFPWLGESAFIGSTADGSRDHFYMAMPFAVVRTIVYFLIWITVALYLRQRSTQQPDADGEGFARRRRTLCAVGLPPVAFAITFASFDWLMSLTPGWSSSIFGIYFFAGAMVGFLGLLCIICPARDRRALSGVPRTTSHYHALGKLLFTFLIFWAYIGFSQYLIIWIADLPSENVWFVARSGGTWSAVAIVLVGGHFLVPFAALLSRRLKRTPSGLAAVGLWLVIMHAVDIYWLVMPALHASDVRPHWLDLAALIGIGGITASCALFLLRSAPSAAMNDPHFARAMRFATD